jgi:RND superfamily putative drug exporter
VNSTTTARRSRTVRIARWSATHPWRAVSLWLVFVAAAITIGGAVGTRTVTNLDSGVGESGRAARMIHAAKLQDPAAEHVLVTARGTAAGNDLQHAALAVQQRLQRVPEAAAVDAPQRSSDGHAYLVTVKLRGDPEKASDHIAGVEAATTELARQFPTLHVEDAGDGSLDKAVNDQVSKDLATAANVSLPVTIVILLVAFGAIVAAGVPVLLALSAVGAATGLSALISHVIPDSGTTSSMILLMGMAVGVDYSLFYVKRARAERRRGNGTLDAIETAAETSGHSVVVSGGAVIVSMLGLFLAGNVVFSSLAAGSVLVVAVAVLGSLTVLPALLVLLGKGVERPRVPLLWRLATQDREPRLWAALVRPAVRRPGRTIVITVLGLGLLAAPALGMKLHSGTLASLPDSIGQKQTLERIGAAFPGQQATHEIVVRAPKAEAPAVDAALTNVAHRAAADPVFVNVSDEKVVASADGTVHVLRLETPYDPESRQAKDGLQRLRTTVVPGALRGVHAASWGIAGDTADGVDSDRLLTERIPWVIGFVVALTTLMMGWVFRSVLIALSTAVMNLLSAGASFGVLVLVFQHHWFEGVLGFHSTGAVINWIPLFTFAVLFGLSMDYHVFVLARIREAAARGLPVRDAIRVGVTGSAGTVTSAAVVMVSVFSIFASLHMVEMKQLGLSLAVAVVIDAVIVRGVLLPALLTLFGTRVWWPGRGPRGAQPSAPELVAFDRVPAAL